MSMNAYKATCEQASKAALRCRAFAKLAQQINNDGQPAEWALKLAREALEESNLYMALARAELARMEDAK
jgi:hypothetical protein